MILNQGIENVPDNEFAGYDQSNASSKVGSKRTSEPKKRVRVRNDSDDENDPDFTISNRLLNQQAKKPNGTYTTNSKLSSGSGITITHNYPTVGIERESEIDNVLFNEMQGDNQMNFANLQVNQTAFNAKFHFRIKILFIF